MGKANKFRELQHEINRLRQENKELKFKLREALSRDKMYGSDIVDAAIKKKQEGHQ